MSVTYHTHVSCLTIFLPEPGIIFISGQKCHSFTFSLFFLIWRMLSIVSGKIFPSSVQQLFLVLCCPRCMNIPDIQLDHMTIFTYSLA